MSLNILQIDCSPRGDESVSRKLTAQIVTQLKSKDSGATVTHKDLSQGVPFVDINILTGYWTPPAEHSEEVKAAVAHSDNAIKEIVDADALVIAAPMWNFNIPATLKAWVDLIVRSGVTFKQSEKGYEPLLPKGKKAYLVVTTGGVPVGSDFDMTSKYMTSVLEFIGITEVILVDAGMLMLEQGKENLAKAEKQIANL